jgi:hypothetical protein
MRWIRIATRDHVACRRRQSTVADACDRVVLLVVAPPGSEVEVVEPATESSGKQWRSLGTIVYLAGP